MEDAGRPLGRASVSPRRGTWRGQEEPLAEVLLAGQRRAEASLEGLAGAQQQIAALVKEVICDLACLRAQLAEDPGDPSISASRPSSPTAGRPRGCYLERDEGGLLCKLTSGLLEHCGPGAEGVVPPFENGQASVLIAIEGPLQPIEAGVGSRRPSKEAPAAATVSRSSAANLMSIASSAPSYPSDGTTSIVSVSDVPHTTSVSFQKDKESCGLWPLWRGAPSGRRRGPGASGPRTGSVESMGKEGGGLWPLWSGSARERIPDGAALTKGSLVPAAGSQADCRLATDWAAGACSGRSAFFSGLQHYDSEADGAAGWWPMVHPDSYLRFVVDMLGALFIMYDVVMVPMQSFPLPNSTFLTVMLWVITVYWTLDIVRQFFLGYEVEDGARVEMRPRVVAGRYLTTWFPVDLCVVLMDYVCVVILGDGRPTSRSWHIGKTLKFLKVMRAIRLVRLVKLVRMWEQAVDSVQSEYLMLALRVFVLLANILLTSHYIACFWYLFGTYDGEDSGWPGYYGLAGASLDRLYVSSLHWAVSQAGFGASALLPVGAAERCYAMAVSLVWFMVLSSSVSFFTIWLLHLKDLKHQILLEEAQIRRFLRERGVSASLTGQLVKSSRLARGKATPRLREGDICSFGDLPSSLQAALRMQLYAPALRRHPVFEWMTRRCKSTMRAVCQLAVAEHHYLAGQEIFARGQQTSAMLHLVSGQLGYYRGPKREVETLEPSSWGTAGVWICEMALWTRCTHQGRLEATAPSELLAVDITAFHSIVEVATHSDKDMRPLCLYAEKVSEHFGALRGAPDSDLWDPSAEAVERIAHEVFDVGLSARFQQLSRRISNVSTWSRS